MKYPNVQIYLAGPYRAKTVAGIDRNIRRAASVARRVWKLGAVPIVPHLNSAWFDSIVPDDWFLQGYLETLARCDAVLLLPKWRLSEGTLAEMQLAQKHEIPVFSEFRALAEWLERLDD